MNRQPEVGGDSLEPRGLHPEEVPRAANLECEKEALSAGRLEGVTRNAPGASWSCRHLVPSDHIFEGARGPAVAS